MGWPTNGLGPYILGRAIGADGLWACVSGMGDNGSPGLGRAMSILRGPTDDPIQRKRISNDPEPRTKQFNGIT